MALCGCTETVEFPGEQSLDGVWQFTYTDTFEQDMPPVPEIDSFSSTMVVPGFWDDHKDRLLSGTLNQKLKYYSGAKAVDFSVIESGRQGYRTKPLPYIEGVGYYRKSFEAPIEWQKVYLEIEEVSQAAWIWVNDAYLGHHLGHSLPFSFDISNHLRAGQQNQVIIAVSNVTDYRGGFSLSGYKGRRGGLTGSVSLRISGSTQIRDCYIQPNLELDSLAWQVEVSDSEDSNNQILVYKILDHQTKQLVTRDTIPHVQTLTSWVTQTFGLEHWSDTAPVLYDIKLELWEHGVQVDQHIQVFGLRRLNRIGRDLYLNGQPIFLRGVTDHCYWAETLTAPRDKDYYMKIIGKLQDVGFNWIRFHTWVPDVAYLEAADELGMLMMVELPEGFGTSQWKQALKLCRTHPSVVLYSGGNEQHLDEEKIESLAKIAELQKQLVPDALFNPQEALRGVEYWWRISDLGSDTTHTPFIHNPSRLKRLKEFSDVFGQYGWGYLSYWSEWGDPQFLDERLVAYERPCLSHEIGIKGNYIDLKQMERMQKSTIGAERYISARKNLEQAEVLGRAETYYENSVAWLHTFRKQTVETVRRTQYYKGYDFLGGHDHNQVGGGYEAGFLNEFFEFKPGDKAEDFLRYNGASVLLLDVGPERIFQSGEQANLALKLSHWGERPINNANVSWELVGTIGGLYQSGELHLNSIPSGKLDLLDTLRLNLPEIISPDHLSLRVSLEDPSHQLQNDWDFWVFPSIEIDLKSDDIIERIDAQTIDRISTGESIVLLGTDIFPKHNLDYTIGLAGRTHGNLATVINDHPIMDGFPHEGWCNWQFRPLFSDTATIVFNDLDLPFEPIIEVVSSYKYIIKQSVLFELKVGSGRLIVASMNFQEGDVSGQYLLSKILNYARNPELHVEAPLVPKEVLESLMTLAGRSTSMQSDGLGSPADKGENEQGNLDNEN